MESFTNNVHLSKGVIATCAIDGINVKNLKCVCHFGQIGHVGRNGDPNCYAVLYSYFSPNKKINKKMKAYTKSKDVCFHTELYSPFIESDNVTPLEMGRTCYCREHQRFRDDSMTKQFRENAHVVNENIR